MLTDIENGKKDTYKFHLAGIIPVGGQPLDFNFPWHDSMVPVSKDLLAVEHAILQCSYAGCETIWIVAHREMHPILRQRIGDWIYDESSLRQARFSSRADQVLKEIPIYYIPIHPKDRDKRDCLAWSVIYGSLRAFHISKVISSWVVPDKYFVAFPYGINCLDSIFNSRELISSSKNFYLSYQNKTIVNGEYLPFTFDKDDFLKFRRVIRDGTGKFTNAHFDVETKRMVQQDKLPIEQRYTARGFTLDKVFGCASIEGANVAPSAWSYRIDSWNNYVEYLSSYEAKNIVRRPKYFKYHEWSGVGVDNIKLGDDNGNC